MTYTGVVQNNQLYIFCQNQPRMQVDLADVCRRANVTYSGKANVSGSDLEIAPPQANGIHIKIPLEEIVIEYATQHQSRNIFERFNQASNTYLKKMLRVIFFERVP